MLSLQYYFLKFNQVCNFSVRNSYGIIKLLYCTYLGETNCHFDTNFVRITDDFITSPQPRVTSVFQALI